MNYGESIAFERLKEHAKKMEDRYVAACAKLSECEKMFGEIIKIIEPYVQPDLIKKCNDALKAIGGKDDEKQI